MVRSRLNLLESSPSKPPELLIMVLHQLLAIQHQPGYIEKKYEALFLMFLPHS